jgi:RNA polymerase sigma-70 factor (ECF subfamily)
MSTSSLAELLQRLRAGDGAAAAEIVRLYQPAILRAVRGRLRHRRLGRLVHPSDICQSVFASFFVRAVAGQYDLTEPGQLLALLLRMAQNRVAFEARKHLAQRRDVRRVAPAGVEELGLAAAGGSPSRLAAGKELLEAVRQRLSAEERQLADLRAQGLAWAEIAARLGGTPDGRRMQLARALDGVARQLGLEEGGPASD